MEDEEIIIVKDCNGTILSEGDSVILQKTLDVKGGGTTLKKGDTLKNIKLIGDSDNIEVRVGKATFVVKTCYLKKK